MKELFGTLTTGESVYAYTLKSGDATLKVLDLGAIIQSFTVGEIDIIGGFDEAQSYIGDASHQGGVIGRVANRVAGASFKMNGKVYNLIKNDGNNSLHGGIGFDRRMWKVVEYGENFITLEYVSQSGEDGYPATLKAKVTYTLSHSTLIISYEATPDGMTPIALTNHSYFNLNGFGGTVLSHKARLYADSFTEVNGELIPNGNHPSVIGTPFDFREPKEIGLDIGEGFNGYDHNIVLSPKSYKSFGKKSLGLGAEIWGDSLMMRVYTDQPGIQFYTANFLGNGPDFKGGVPQIKYGGLCLETQTEPDSLNHGIGFYDKGDTYTHTAVYEITKI